jgi:hypothetical protein
MITRSSRSTASRSFDPSAAAVWTDSSIFGDALGDGSAASSATNLARPTKSVSIVM